MQCRQKQSLKLPDAMGFVRFFSRFFFFLFSSSSFKDHQDGIRIVAVLLTNVIFWLAANSINSTEKMGGISRHRTAMFIKNTKTKKKKSPFRAPGLCILVICSSILH